MIERFGMVHAAIILVYVAIDIIGNSIYIKKVGEPNHKILWFIRIIIILLVTHYGASNVSEWFWRTINAGILFWFCFDYGLNIARGKNLSYIGIEIKAPMLEIIRDNFWRGKVSLLDQLQLKTLGEYPWFVFKGIAAIFCLINMLFSYNPYSPL